MLWMVGERDGIVGIDGTHQSARYYGSEAEVIPETGHNMMMEHAYQQAAEKIHCWLVAQDIE